jgi:hypothetical protein
LRLCIGVAILIGVIRSGRADKGKEGKVDL